MVLILSTPARQAYRQLCVKLYSVYNALHCLMSPKLTFLYDNLTTILFGNFYDGITEASHDQLVVKPLLAHINMVWPMRSTTSQCLDV